MRILYTKSKATGTGAMFFCVIISFTFRFIINNEIDITLSPQMRILGAMLRYSGKTELFKDRFSLPASSAENSTNSKPFRPIGFSISTPVLMLVLTSPAHWMFVRSRAALMPTQTYNCDPFYGIFIETFPLICQYFYLIKRILLNILIFEE